MSAILARLNVPVRPGMPGMPAETVLAVQNYSELFRTVQNCSGRFGHFEVVWYYFIEKRGPKAPQLGTLAYGALRTLSESQVQWSGTQGTKLRP